MEIWPKHLKLKEFESRHVVWNDLIVKKSVILCFIVVSCFVIVVDNGIFVVLAYIYKWSIVLLKLLSIIRKSNCHSLTYQCLC